MKENSNSLALEERKVLKNSGEFSLAYSQLKRYNTHREYIRNRGWLTDILVIRLFDYLRDFGRFSYTPTEDSDLMIKYYVSVDGGIEYLLNRMVSEAKKNSEVPLWDYFELRRLLLPYTLSWKWGRFAHTFQKCTSVDLQILYKDEVDAWHKHVWRVFPTLVWCVSRAGSSLGKDVAGLIFAQITN